MSTASRLATAGGAVGMMLFFSNSAFAAGMESPAREIVFTPQMGVVFAVLALVIVLFVFEWVRVDVVGIMMMVLLPILGLVTPQEAVSGLSSNAVVAIIAVIIIGAGLDKTGCMNVLARRILALAGKSENRLMALISATVALISQFHAEYRGRRPVHASSHPHRQTNRYSGITGADADGLLRHHRRHGHPGRG